VNLLARLSRLLSFDIWRANLDDEPTGWRWLVATARLLTVVSAGFNRHRFMTQAAALTFTTVFGLVPTLAVGFAMFKAFGGLDDAQALLLPWIVDYLAVGVQDQVAMRLEEMLRNIHGGAIGAVGSLFMFAAVVSLLNSIEDTFNDIWGVKQARGVVRRITGYWAVVTITPVLLIGGLSLPAMVRRIEPIAWTLEHTTWVAVVFSRLFPLLLICGGFALLYGLLTAARVPLRAAVIGGCVAGVSWMTAVSAYAAYAGQSAFYTTLYGPLATIPIFLFWIYLSWVIVLVGAQFAFASENIGSYRDAILDADTTPAQRELLALAVLAGIAQRFSGGGDAPTRAELHCELESSGRLVNQMIDELIEKGFVFESQDGNAISPAHDPRTVAVADVIAALRGSAVAKTMAPAVLADIAAAMDHAEAAAGAAWKEMTWADLADSLRAVPSAKPS